MCVSGSKLKHMGAQFYNEIHAQEAVPEFNGSEGWLRNFLKRHGLTKRRVTTTGRELPADALNSIRKFFKTSREAFEAAGSRRSQVLNMDETSIYLDYPPNYTYENKGRKQVPIDTAGAERTRISASFTGKPLKKYSNSVQ